MAERAIKAVVVRPGEKASIETVCVDGDVVTECADDNDGRVLSPFQDQVALVCEKQPNSNPHNRTVRSHDGKVNPISGMFIVVGIDGTEVCDLTDELAEKYKSMFLFPEKLYRHENDIVTMQYETF